MSSAPLSNLKSFESTVRGEGLISAETYRRSWCGFKEYVRFDFIASVGSVIIPYDSSRHASPGDVPRGFPQGMSQQFQHGFSFRVYLKREVMQCYVNWYFLMKPSRKNHAIELSLFLPETNQNGGYWSVRKTIKHAHTNICSEETCSH